MTQRPLFDDVQPKPLPPLPEPEPATCAVCGALLYQDEDDTGDECPTCGAEQA